ncbi:Htaa protein [Subtercola boreus]|nr:Htaa protein [Subtercola boreus]
MTLVAPGAGVTAPAQGARLAQGARPAQGARLEWAVKASFVAYVEALPDGKVETFGGAARAADGRFLFAAAGGTEGDLAFTGTLRFSGHHGVLDVLLSDPRIETVGGLAALTIAVGAERVHIATIGHLEAGTPGTGIHSSEGAAARADTLTAATLTGTGVTATDDGAHLLGGVYSAGTPLDDLVILRVAAPAPALA